MSTYTLKLFNTGQITLPKAWRDKQKTKHFIARETKKGLLIEPIKDEDIEVIPYETDKEVGLIFPKGIDPRILINKIKEIDG
jgi:hypothetical protein